MRNIKAFVIAAVLAVSMCGCASGYAENESKQEQSRMVCVYSDGWVRIFEDTKTGVQYFVPVYDKGAVCPLYNADGTLYVGD